jgi:hypothetical protein
MRGLVMALSLTDLAGVIGPEDGISQSREGRQEHGALELFVSTPARQFTPDGEPDLRVTGASPAQAADGV